MSQPNIVFLLADQLTAKVLSCYGGKYVPTPHIDQLASESTRFTSMISTCPVCTPYRSMLLTGRHPQTTGHVVNFMDTRHDEIGWGDIFSHAGYKTAWIGKWHLHTGSFPQIDGADYVPAGRDRLGFQHWRGYNFHTDFFRGSYNLDNWHVEHWEEYETDAMNRLAFEFMDNVKDEPFCCFISPHQPHCTNGKYAPDKYFQMLPEQVALPDGISGKYRKEAEEQMRNYLAMILALDDMVGELLDYLNRNGLQENTILVFTSDHGTQMGLRNEAFWNKKTPYQESVHVPMLARWPGVLDKGINPSLITPVDLLPTLCSMCGIHIPSTVEGTDLSEAWKNFTGAKQRGEALTMNFIPGYDYLDNGQEWRGVHTGRYNYAKWLDGREVLFDLLADPDEKQDLSSETSSKQLLQDMREKLDKLLKTRSDSFLPGTAYEPWFDSQRRVVQNCYGKLLHPETEPDWSLL